MDGSLFLYASKKHSPAGKCLFVIIRSFTYSRDSLSSAYPVYS